MDKIGIGSIQEEFLLSEFRTKYEAVLWLWQMESQSPIETSWLGTAGALPQIRRMCNPGPGWGYCNSLWTSASTKCEFQKVCSWQAHQCQDGEGELTQHPVLLPLVPAKSLSPGDGGACEGPSAFLRLARGRLSIPWGAWAGASVSQWPKAQITHLIMVAEDWPRRQDIQIF